MKKWNVWISLCMAGCLLLSVPAQAEVVIPPVPSTGAAQTGQEKGPGIGLDQTQNQNQSQNQNGTAVSVEKPQIASEGAVLLDASTGTFLYEKNADTRFYPASITKLMTALLVAERCQLTDTVTFSETATHQFGIRGSFSWADSRGSADCRAVSVCTAVKVSQ